VPGGVALVRRKDAGARCLIRGVSVGAHHECAGVGMAEGIVHVRLALPDGDYAVRTIDVT